MTEPPLRIAPVLDATATFWCEKGGRGRWWYVYDITAEVPGGHIGTCGVLAYADIVPCVQEVTAMCLESDLGMNVRPEEVRVAVIPRDAEAATRIPCPVKPSGGRHRRRSRKDIR